MTSEPDSAESTPKKTPETGPKRRLHRPLDIGTRIEAEQVRLLFELGEASRLTMFWAILIVGLAFSATAPLWATGVVLLIQLIAQISFDRVRAGFDGDPDAVGRALIWARRYAAVALISGSTWGMGALVWLPGSSFAHHIFYALVVSCLAMATAVTRSTYPPAIIAYITPIALPTLALLLLSGEPLAMATVALAAVLVLAIGGWTRRVHRSYREAIRLRFENADLVERMARAHAATEQKRQDAEEAERTARAANKAKGEFLAILSHEVRTPLDGIARMAKLLRQEPLSESQTNLSQAIGESSRMLRRLFDDMIDFSQMEADALELKPLSFDPAEIARSVTRLMRPQAAERGLSLELDLAPGTPPYIVTDPDRLRQVLVNLISNGIKFTETGGVMLRLQPVAFAQGGAGVRFSVLDTGIGLPPEAQARLFDSFAQGETANGHGRPDGMGLGLAISDRLVALMGGRIQVDSAPGRGSTFSFLIPQEAGTASASPAPVHALTHAAEPGDAAKGARRERLVDHDHLYELERELGQTEIAERLVETLEAILDLQDGIDAALEAQDAGTLRDKALALGRQAADIGLVALAGVANDIGQAAERGQAEQAINDVPRLHQKISATRRALADVFPGLGA